ncbi:MAG: type II and III secretion system protein family protein [Pseudomonadota bacterium]
MKRAFLTAAIAATLTVFAPTLGSHTGAISASSAMAESLIKLRDDGAASAQNVQLGLNKSIVIDLPRDAHDLLIASPTVADGVIRSRRRIYVFGKSVGETNIFIFDRAGAPILSLNLEVERDIGGIQEKLKRFIPGSKIKVELINDNVVLTGSVQTPQDADRAVQLASAFVKGGEATTGAFTQTATSGGNAAAGGVSLGAVAISQPQIRESAIINLLKIAAEDQVTLKVTIAEVQRSVMKQMGFSASANYANGTIGFGVNKNNSFGLANQGGTGTVGFGGSIGDVGFQTNLHAFERAGVARTLAEPTLTAISGKEASFKVGGSYFVGGGRQRSVEEFNGQDREIFTDTFVEKEYGIGLNFTPVVLAPGRISIEVATEVSEPDVQGSANDGVGGIFSGMRKREAQTTVELPSGGSLMIAGLVQDSIRQAVTKIPGLGNLPILGTLFRSRDFQRDETELVIIVTPYLVRPVANHQLQRPDNNFQATSDINANFLGRVSKVYGRKTPEGSRYNGKIGFIIQ